MGYPHEICSIGRLKIGDAKSAPISKKIFADLRKVFACTVTYIRIIICVEVTAIQVVNI